MVLLLSFNKLGFVLRFEDKNVLPIFLTLLFKLTYSVPRNPCQNVFKQKPIQLSLSQGC